MNNDKVIEFLNLHHSAFFEAHPYAEETQHPTPSDTRSWSQILISLITGINGLAQKKGADLSDGSDVKGANTWKAIDTPRFNGVIKAATKSAKSGKLEYLDDLPHLYFVLWDNEPETDYSRCRVWVVRTREDKLFRKMCLKWYKQRDAGEIISPNFQLHPPRGKNHNVFRNMCANLHYPLLMCAVFIKDTYVIKYYDEQVISSGECKEA